AVVCWWIYHDRETARKIFPIDTIGLILLIIWVAALQIMLDKGIKGPATKPCNIRAKSKKGKLVAKPHSQEVSTKSIIAPVN
ncbi:MULTISPECIES: hypothetical protein, partial [unclassified Legionella]|uniref:hypothetical protein n=1 Tax=unclassified Legionella TaxID=2622702 RepID=UPI003AF9444E